MGHGATIKQRMIDAGESLLARRGYGITMLEVMNEAGTPRGSIYYHFPGGKEQLAIEVARKVGDDIEELVAMVATKTRSPVAFLQGLIDLQVAKLANSDFREGCPMLGLTVSVDIDSAELDEAVAATFERWTQAVATELKAKGVNPVRSLTVASTVVAAIEGAMVVCRATRSAQPLKRVRAVVPGLVP